VPYFTILVTYSAATTTCKYENKFLLIVEIMRIPAGFRKWESEERKWRGLETCSMTSREETMSYFRAQVWR
jgi:hypothetical protein